MNESVTNEVVRKETLTPIPANSSFMCHKEGLYPKARITLLDAQLLNESKQQQSYLLEEFSDIMSKSSTDIILTHLEEMVLPSEPGATPLNYMIYPLNITSSSRKS